MNDSLNSEWNSDPAPTKGFLDKLAVYRKIEKHLDQGDGIALIDAYHDLIDSISTKSDLGQFLQETYGDTNIGARAAENRDVSVFWEALSGTVVDFDFDDENPWRSFAYMLNAALSYE